MSKQFVCDGCGMVLKEPNSYQVYGHLEQLNGIGMDVNFCTWACLLDFAGMKLRERNERLSATSR